MYYYNETHAHTHTYTQTHIMMCVEEKLVNVFDVFDGWGERECLR